MGEIDKYVNTVCQQMRWKKARQRVFDEMTTHIVDSRDAYIGQGFDEQAATAQAIADTGDAAVLGASFDRVHRPKPQWGMIGAVIGFLVLGIVIDLFMHDTWNDNGRLVFTGIGLMAMLAAYFVDFTILGKYPWVIISAFLVLMAFLAWISVDIGFARGQALSLIFPLVFVTCIFALRDTGIKGIAVSGAAYAVLCVISGLLFFASFFHFSVVGMAILLVVIWRNWFSASKYLKILGTFLLIIPFTALAIWGVLFESRSRIAIAFNPHLEPLGHGFSALQARRVLSGAVLLGEGGVNIYWLPDARHNFFLTSIASRYGWLPFIAIVCALAAFIAIGFIRCFKQKSGLGFLVSFAVIATFSIQVVTFVAFNLGFTLVMMTLPLISPGNSALLANLVLVGFMLSVFRTGDAVPRHKPPQSYSSPQVQ